MCTRVPEQAGVLEQPCLRRVCVCVHALAGQGQSSRGVWAVRGGSEGVRRGGREPAGQRAAGPLCVYLCVSLRVSLCISVCARVHRECVPGPRARGEQSSGLFAGGALWRTHSPRGTRVFLQPLAEVQLIVALRPPRRLCLSSASARGARSPRVRLEVGLQGRVPEIVGLGFERSPHRGGRCSVAVPATATFFFFFFL